jgi:hypothetical protein
MGLYFDEEKRKEFEAIGVRSKRRNLRTLKQTGKIGDLERDLARKSLLPGKRISKNGKTYWETRKNRTDAKNSKL